MSYTVNPTYLPYGVDIISIQNNILTISNSNNNYIVKLKNIADIHNLESYIIKVSDFYYLTLFNDETYIPRYHYVFSIPELDTPLQILSIIFSSESSKIDLSSYVLFIDQVTGFLIAIPDSDMKLPCYYGDLNISGNVKVTEFKLPYESKEYKEVYFPLFGTNTLENVLFILDENTYWGYNKLDIDVHIKYWQPPYIFSYNGGVLNVENFTTSKYDINTSRIITIDHDAILISIKSKVLSYYYMDFSDEFPTLSHIKSIAFNKLIAYDEKAAIMNDGEYNYYTDGINNIPLNLCFGEYGTQLSHERLYKEYLKEISELEINPNLQELIVSYI